MTFWQTKAFKTLQEAWYERLEADGFVDAEELIGSDMVLKQTASHAYRDLDGLGIESKECYFHIISQKVQETVFTSDIDRLILTRHSEGKKIVQICRELEERGERRFRKTITFKIRRYEMQWGIRQYTPRQLNKRVG